MYIGTVLPHGVAVSLGASLFGSDVVRIFLPRGALFLARDIRHFV